MKRSHSLSLIVALVGLLGVGCSENDRSELGSSLKKTGEDVAQKTKAAGEKVVFTNGCFDLLHPGHVRVLEKSRSLGDRLIVAINSDQSVHRLKGPTRPILAFETPHPCFDCQNFRYARSCMAWS